VRWLGLTDAEPWLIDVGGGAALFSRALLVQNAKARATQLDWPHINQIAKAEIDSAGVSARFDTIDGDFKTTVLPAAKYDVAVLSNIVHQESEASALALMKGLREGLKPGGRLVVVEFLVEDGRVGPAMPLMFNLAMLVNTSGGRSYEKSHLARLFREAGFAEPELKRIGPVSTVAAATRT
jgi:SAM-dependent methyltransferase